MTNRITDQANIGEPVSIRACDDRAAEDIARIINAAAVAYRGVIPDDCWHEPYMPLDVLRSEIAAGVRFTCCHAGDDMVGVMGLQYVRNVRLIRHAYVVPECQGKGIGSMLLDHLTCSAGSPILIGTWAAADWAIGFYERHGFQCVPAGAIADLLRTYWGVPERQIVTSVVLARPALSIEGAAGLIAQS